MKNKKLVSVIIVNYNGREYIGECVDSIIQSDYLSVEIIIVDNDSSDGSYAFLQKKYGREKKVKLIKSQENLFFTGGCNLGAKTSQGEWLFFLNSDAIIKHDCIAKLIDFVQNRSNFLVQPKILIKNKDAKSKKQEAGNKRQEAIVIDNVGGRLSRWGAGYGIGHGEEDSGQYDKNRKVDFVNGTAFIIQSDFFRELGGFDERFEFFYEDLDLSVRAQRRGGSCWGVYEAVVYHISGRSFRENWNKLAIKRKLLHSCLLFNRKRISRALSFGKVR